MTFDADLIIPIFFSLIRTLYFAGAVSMISIGFTIAFCVMVIPIRPKVLDMLFLCGRLIFVAPPFIIASSVLLFLVHLDLLSWIGLPALLLGHCFIFVLYGISVLYPQFQLKSTENLLRYAIGLGLSEKRARVLVIRHHLKPQAISLAYRFFIMSTLSFSMVLFLGGRSFEMVAHVLYDALLEANFTRELGVLLALFFSIIWILSLKILKTKPSSVFLNAGASITSRQSRIHRNSRAYVTDGLGVGLILMTISPLLIVFFSNDLKSDSFIFLFLSLWPMTFKTLGISFLIAVFVLSFVLSLISIFMHSQKSLSLLLNAADLFYAIPKLGIVLVLGCILVWFPRSTSGQSIEFFLICIAFLGSYWGYSYRALWPALSEFRSRYFVYCLTLSISKTKFVWLFLSNHSRDVISLLAELICFCLGNLAIFLFFLDPDQDVLSTKAFDAMLDFKMETAHACFIWILILMCCVMGVAKGVRYRIGIFGKQRFSFQRLKKVF